MKYLKRIFESYDYTKDPVINDLKELSLDLIDSGATLYVLPYSNYNQIGRFEFNHEVRNMNIYNYNDLIPDRYVFHYVFHKNKLYKTTDIERVVNEIYSIISEMYPDIEFELNDRYIMDGINIIE